MTEWIRTLWPRMWAVLRKKQQDREFDEELSAHLDMLIEELRRKGMAPVEAQQEALRKLGRPQALRETHREQRGLPVIEVLAQDLRYAVRMLWKSRAFTIIATLTLALGIGANTALFSLVDNLLLRSLPVRDPQRLVQVQHTNVTGYFKKPRTHFTKELFDSVRKDSAVIAEVVGFSRMDRPTVMVDGAIEPPREVERVSENFFRDLGVTPVLGRTPEASDSGVAMISYRWWRSRFEGSASALGRTVTVNGQISTIIGVAPPRFLGLSLENAPDLWISTGPAADQMMIARLRQGVTPVQAQAALDPLFPQLEGRERGLPELRVELESAGKGLSFLRAQYERPLWALSVLVTLVLLITCTNVGNLLMVRNSARRRELTMRVALGARRSRLIVQCLVESAVLAALGGALGLIFARWGVSIILSMLPLPVIPQALAFQTGARVLSFAIIASIASALLFGLAPAWRATQVDLTAALKASQGSTPAKGARRLGRALVACQVGLSVLLLVAAGLFVQTLRNLTRLDLGYNTENLLQVSIDTRSPGYRGPQVTTIYRLLLERVSAINGVQSVTVVRNPLIRGLSRCASTIPGIRRAPDETWDCVDVGPSFFETLNIPLLRGRLFTEADFARGQRLYIVNDAFLKHFFPDSDPVGKTNIIGVVGNAKLSSLRRASGPLMYYMVPNEPDRISAMEVRAAGKMEGITRAIGEEIRRIHPRLLLDIKSVRQEIDQDIAKERMVAATSAFFSLLGLLLASIGIFGVASYTVAQRTNELGIRMALGAGRWPVIRESLRESMLVFSAGLAAGIIAAVIAVRLTASFISDLLFGLSPTDTLNMVIAVAVMAGVAVAACILPARRATRIDPLAAIRYE